MENDSEPARKRGLTAFGREMRLARILARLREGWAYDEVGREERLTAERVRQIVRKGLEGRPIDETTDHAKLQLARLQPAMRIAGAAVERGDVAAIAPLLKVLDRLDRYQRSAKVNEVYDDEARKKLFDKLNRVAANLGLAVIKDPTKAELIPASAIPAPAIMGPQAAPVAEPGEPKGEADEKEKTPWGVGASP